MDVVSAHRGDICTVERVEDAAAYRSDTCTVERILAPCVPQHVCAVKCAVEHSIGPARDEPR